METSSVPTLLVEPGWRAPPPQDVRAVIGERKAVNREEMRARRRVHYLRMMPAVTITVAGTGCTLLRVCSGLPPLRELGELCLLQTVGDVVP